MATVAQVAKASLQRILVQAAESPLEPAEYQDYIFALNNYMTQLDAQGVQLGYTEVSDLGDAVTVRASLINENKTGRKYKYNYKSEIVSKAGKVVDVILDIRKMIYNY